MRNNRAITFVELLVTLSILGFLSLLVVRFTPRLKNSMSVQFEWNRLQGDATELSDRLHRYFGRATSIQVAQIPSVGLSNVIERNGAVVLTVDNRDCDQFDPATSAANLSTVQLVCCGAQASAVIGAGAIQSRCNKNGFSIVEISPTGQQVYATCFEGYYEFNMMGLGNVPATGQPLYALEFSATPQSFASVQSQLYYKLQFTDFESIGNVPGSPTIACRTSAQ